MAVVQETPPSPPPLLCITTIFSTTLSHLHHHHHRHISITANTITITTITLSHLHHTQQSSTILHNGCVGSEVTVMVAVVEVVVMGGMGGGR